MEIANKNVSVVTIKIKTTPRDEAVLDNKFYVANRIYNAGVKHYKKVVNRLLSDERYEEALKNKDYKTIKLLAQEYKLSKYDLTTNMGAQAKRAYYKALPALVVNSLANDLSMAIEKAIFKGTEIHFRKRGATSSLSAKTKGDIIFNELEHTVKFKGRVYKLYKIRESDTYLQHMLKYNIKYCRIVRKAHRSGYKYYLQIVLDGKSLKKLSSGSEITGLDPGISTMAYVNASYADFVELARSPEITKVNKEIVRLSRKLERQRRLVNPQCYNEDGTIIKGSRFIHRTKGYYKTLFRLKDAWRRRSVYITQEHNKLAKKIISSSAIIVTEKMNYAAFKRKSKNLERSDKTSKVTNKKGETKEIRKFKRRKRFGKSIQSRCPGQFIATLKHKAEAADVPIVYVNSTEFKASQYDHTTQMATKPLLSARVKEINGNLVQRDLYSAFLLSNFKNKKSIDFAKCEETFENFLLKQNEVVTKMKSLGDNTKNFGLKHFCI